jgi:hypothetical protein
LVAVSGSAPFWQRFGFHRVDVPEIAVQLASYDADTCLMMRVLARDRAEPA